MGLETGGTLDAHLPETHESMPAAPAFVAGGAHLRQRQRRVLKAAWGNARATSQVIHGKRYKD